MTLEIPNKIDELRTGLINMGEKEEVVARMSKTDLKKLFSEKLSSDDESETFQIRFDDSDQQEFTPETLEGSLPKYGSKEWQTYVLSLLESDEHIDGFPRCVGLRRIAQLLLGPIVSSKPTQVSVVPRVNTDGEASSRAVTVLYEVTFDWMLNRPVVIQANGHSYNDYRVFGGAADCVEEIDSMFGRHPAASAETKAESRALKKALSLNIISAEEKVSGYDDSQEGPTKDSGINKQLVAAIEAKVNALGLSMKDVLREYGKPHDDIADLTLDDGRKLFRLINEKYQQV